MLLRTPSDTTPSSARVEYIYQAAVAQHHALLEFPESEIKSTITTALREIATLEAIGEKEINQIRISKHLAEHIGLVWVFSGPGTYTTTYKQDKYSKFTWAAGMDRARIDHAALLLKTIAEVKSGLSSFEEPLADTIDKSLRVKRLIEKHSPNMYYNGSEAENNALREAVTHSEISLPTSKVIIDGRAQHNTIEQVQTFSPPDAIQLQGKVIGLVSHAPHLVRILHIAEKLKPFPPNTRIVVFPLPTPPEGTEEYSTMEILGILAYAYLSHNGSAAAHPHQITRM